MYAGENETPGRSAFVSLRDILAFRTPEKAVFRAAFLIAGFGVLVKLAAALKDTFVAHRFGVGDPLDAFVMAFLLITFALSVIGGALASALIPTYIEMRERQGNVAAQRLLSAASGMTLLLLGCAAVAIAAGSGLVLPLIAAGFSQDKLQLTRSLLLLMVPSFVLSGFGAFCAAVLNAHRRFRLPVLVQLGSSAAIVLLLLIGPSLGVYALAGGVLTGSAVEAAVLSVAVRGLGISVWPRWPGRTPEMRQVLGQYAPMVAGALFMSGTGLVDHAMATWLPSGSVSAFNYGNKLVAVVTTLGSMALATVTLPFFSSLAARGEWRELRGFLRRYRDLVFFGAIPATLLLILLSRFLVEIWFRHGAFTEADARLVTRIQVLLLIQVPFVMAGMAYVRLLSALKANAALMWGSALNFVVNVVFNFLLMKWLGVAGIALSTSFVYVVSLLYLRAAAMRRLREIEASPARPSSTDGSAAPGLHASVRDR